MRILVVEDDPILSNGLKVGLGLTGATVDQVANCADALAALHSSSFDAMVLDLMLPDGSGMDVLKTMRANKNQTPVLLLTALDETADRITGLDSGADDYMGKPFDLDELAARVRAIARRHAGRAQAVMKAGNVELDPSRLTAKVKDEPISLSRREFAVLSALMERPGIVHSKSDIEAKLYGWQEEVESNTIEVHIHNLRNKIGREAIETVRGLGYRMRVTS